MEGQDPFSGIAVFVRAAEARSFTGAARLLGLTPSAVSKSVSRLEAELGVRLFNRSPREVTLTGEGEAFFARCRDLVREAEDARALLGGGTLRPQGRLRVCVPVSFGQSVVAPALAPWLQDHPGLKIELVLTDRQVDMAEERFDAAIRLGDPPDSRLVARKLPPHVFLTLAAPAYLARHGEPRTPAALAGHDCLGYLMAATGTCRAWTFTRNGKTETLPPAGSATSDHAYILTALAEAGRGIIQTPRYLAAQAVAEGRLQPILAGYTSEGPPLWLVYPLSRQKSLKIQAFSAFALSLGAYL